MCFEFIAQHSVGLGDLSKLEDRYAVHAAMERSGAPSLLIGFPSGAETQLGVQWEAGIDLSTGQWQKLALGRAFMRDNPLLLFFDEPTASLDALAEHELFEKYAQQGACRFHARCDYSSCVSQVFERSDQQIW